MAHGGDDLEGDRNTGGPGSSRAADILRSASESRRGLAQQVLIAQADTRTATDARARESRETGPEQPAWNEHIMLTFDDSLRNAPDIIDHLEQRGISRYRFYAEAGTAMRPEALREMGVVKNVNSTRITPGLWLTQYVDPRRGALTREQFMRRYMIKNSPALGTNYLENGRKIRDWFIAKYPGNWLEMLEETFGYHAAILHPAPTDKRNHIQYWTPAQICEDIETFETFMRAWLNITEFHVRHLRTPGGGGFGYDAQFDNRWYTGTGNARKLVDTVTAFRPGATWDMWTVNSFDANKNKEFDTPGVAHAAIASIEHPEQKSYAPQQNLLLLHSNHYDRARLRNLDRLTNELDRAYYKKYARAPERPHSVPAFETIHAAMESVPSADRYVLTAEDRRHIDASFGAFAAHLTWQQDQYFTVVDQGSQFACLYYYSSQTQQYYLVGDFGVKLGSRAMGFSRSSPAVLSRTHAGGGVQMNSALMDIIERNALLDGKSGRYVFVQNSREAFEGWGKISGNGKLWSAGGAAVAVLGSGQDVYVLGQRGDGYLVRLRDGTEGFVSRQMVQINKPPPTEILKGPVDVPRTIQGKEVVYELGNWPPARLASLINQLKQLPSQEQRMMAIFQAWKEIPYKKRLAAGLRHGYENYTAEEEGRYRNKVVVRLDKMDCTEFPIYALALMGANDVNGFIQRLVELKYRDGVVGDENKMHYTYLRMLNWQSHGLVSDIAPTLPRDLTATEARMSTSILNRQERSKQPYTYLPENRVDQAAPYLRTGDVFGFVLSNAKVDSLGSTSDGTKREQIIGHMGFIYIEGGRVYFMHSNASRYEDGTQAGISIAERYNSAAKHLKKGTKRLLSAYLNENSDWKGIVVMRPQLPYQPT